jgi:hypothetical protein
MSSADDRVVCTARRRLVRLVVSAGVLVCVVASGAVAQPTDAIDLAHVEFHMAPDHVKTWPITNPITKIELSSQHGVGVTLADRDRWPDFVPPGWDGPLNWTLWLFVKCQGRWHGAALIEYWDGKGGRSARYWTGAPLLTNYADWVYPNPGSPWGVMGSCAPKHGDPIAFMAAPVSHRMNKNHETVRERSNVVFVAALVEDAVYDYGHVPPVPPPVPPGPPPPPVPPSDLEGRVNILQGQVMTLAQVVRDYVDRVEGLTVHAAGVDQRLAVLESRRVPVRCKAAASLYLARVPLSCTIEYE